MGILTSPATVADHDAIGQIDLRVKSTNGYDFFEGSETKAKPTAQEYIEKVIKGAKWGEAVEVPQPKQIDYLGQTFLKTKLTGIVAGAVDATTASGYPFLVPDDDCTWAHDKDKCVPAQEKAFEHFNFDFIDSLSSDTDASVKTRSRVNRPFAHYVQGAGVRAVQKLAFQFGDTCVQELDYLVIFALDELSGAPGKRHTYMSGFRNSREELITASETDHYVYCALPLFWTHDMRLYLEMYRLQLGDAKFTLTLPTLKQMIIVSSKGVTPTKSVMLSDAGDGKGWHVGVVTAADAVSNRGSKADGSNTAGDAIGDTDCECAILQQVFYLTEEERLRRIQAAGTDVKKMTIVNYKHKVQTLSKTEASNDVKITGYQATKTVLLLLQLKANVTANDWTNFSRIGPDVASSGGDAGTHETRFINRDPTELDLLEEVSIWINEQQRWRPVKAVECRGVYPHVHHTNVPEVHKGHFLYTIPISHMPEDQLIYSGSINPGRLTSVVARVTLKSSDAEGHDTSVVGQEVQAHLITVNYNEFVYQRHTGGASFLN